MKWEFWQTFITNHPIISLIALIFVADAVGKVAVGFLTGIATLLVGR